MKELTFAIEYLKKYNHLNTFLNIKEEDQLRALMNITMPINLDDAYYEAQDAYLQKRLTNLTITDSLTLDEILPRISLWQGDITKIKADAIVNACNNQLLGCFVPLHRCIDNAIHSYAGLQVRRDLMKIMDDLGHNETNGQVKVTKGYNLPSKYIMHTVGPIVKGKPTLQDQIDLTNCYLSCLKKAEEMNLKTIVFCSIATGLYGYPLSSASQIAVKTVTDYLKTNQTIEKVIFNVFSKGDYDVYIRTIKEMV